MCMIPCSCSRSNVLVLTSRIGLSYAPVCLYGCMHVAVCSAVDPTSTLLSSLPSDVHSKHAITIQQMTLRAWESVAKNLEKEYDVIATEHCLQQKLGQIETLENSKELGGSDSLRHVLQTPEQ